MITFKNRAADTIQVGDLMRRVEETDTHTHFDYYRATSVFIGDVQIPVHDGNGVFIGNAVDRNVVQIEWMPATFGRAFTMRYARNTNIEIATGQVDDVANLTTLIENED